MALHRLIGLHEHGHVPRTDLRRCSAARASSFATPSRPTPGTTRLSAPTPTSSTAGRCTPSCSSCPGTGYLPPARDGCAPRTGASRADLGAGCGLLYRYRAKPDWREGAFGICGFWAAEYLALGGGSEEEAHSRIAALLRFANDVGLFSEEVDPATGAALGNFPQAFTHIGLVNACLTLANRQVGRAQLTHQHALPRVEEIPVERSAEHDGAGTDWRVGEVS